MCRFTIQPGGFLFAIIASAMLLSGCGGGDEGDDTTPDVDTLQSESTGVAAAVSNLTIQMTGLLLIVPPTSGDSVHVLLPQPGSVGEHRALFGFGIPQDGPEFDQLCVSSPFGSRARQARICYVDLEEWDLEPFGAGGQFGVPTVQELSTADPGLLNVTATSGTRHKVHFPDVEQEIVSRVTLLSGRPAGTPCRLATWKFEPADEHGTPSPTPRSESLTNVLNWRVQGLNAASAVLVFTHTSGTQKRIQLPVGESQALLAYIPAGDTVHLPPEPETAVTDNAVSADHFHAYYDVLSAPGTSEPDIDMNSTRRRIPHSRTSAPGTRSCRVTVRMAGGPSPLLPSSLATYACMPAIGERGS